MKYLKVYTNFRRSMQGLTDDEKGRLFDAMLSYIESGEEPTFSGNERFLWGAVLNMFDAQKVFDEKQRANGAKGGRPSQKPNKTQINPTEPNETQANPENPKRKEKKRKEIKRNITPTEYEGETPLEIALDEFRQYRKESKHPLSELAEKKLLTELEKLSGGDDEKKIQILDQSIRNDWRGVFALKEKNTRQTYAQHPATNLDHLLVNLDD